MRRKDSVLEDFRAESIRELEQAILGTGRSKISEYNSGTKANGKQELMVHLRSLRLKIEGMLVDLGFRDHLYLQFEYRVVDGEHVFGPADGAMWWQIIALQIGSGNVLIAIVVFQDGSWVKRISPVSRCTVSINV
jgi:hypothetical protein